VRKTDWLIETYKLFLFISGSEQQSTLLVTRKQGKYAKKNCVIAQERGATCK